jgi:hypothetical protein
MGMKTQHSRMGVHYSHEFARTARVFGRNDIGIAQHVRQSVRDISQVA